jgi:hypothetical protein
MNSMYLHTIDTYRRGLNAMLKWLDKAQDFADAKKFDVDTLLTARLAPDMYPFVWQVQSVCDCAKGQPALLCGKEPPKHENNEKTFSELRQRIEKTLAYLATFKPEDFNGCEDRRVPIPTGPDKWIIGGEFVDQIANPNFFFHASIAYAILRHNGVDIGKRDFLGDVNVRQG